MAEKKKTSHREDKGKCVWMLSEKWSLADGIINGAAWERPISFTNSSLKANKHLRDGEMKGCGSDRNTICMRIYLSLSLSLSLSLPPSLFLSLSRSLSLSLSLSLSVCLPLSLYRGTSRDSQTAPICQSWDYSCTFSSPVETQFCHLSSSGMF